MTNYYETDDCWPKSATEIKKVLSSGFIELFGSKLEKMGFIYKGNTYYRAYGSIYQAVGIHNTKYKASILLSLLPYWTNGFIDHLYRVDPKHKACFPVFSIDDSISNGKGHHIINNLDRNLYVKDIPEFISSAYRGFEEYYFDMLDSVKDENSYLHLYDGDPMKYKYVFFWMPEEEIVLYEAYKRGSIEELIKLNKLYFTSKKNYWKKSNKQAIAGKIMHALEVGNMDFIKEFHNNEAEKMKKYFYDGWKLNFTDS